MANYIKNARTRRKLLRMSPNEASNTIAGNNAGFLLSILVHLHSGLERHEHDAAIMVEYVVQNRRPLGLPEQVLPAPSRQDGEKPLTAHEWKRMGAELDRRRAQTATDTCHIRGWLAPLQEILGLNDTETFILGIIFLYMTNPVFEQFWDALTRNHGRNMALCDDIPLFQLLSGAPESAIAQALGPEGRLRTSGIIALDDDGDISLLPGLPA